MKFGEVQENWIYECNFLGLRINYLVYNYLQQICVHFSIFLVFEYQFVTNWVWQQLFIDVHISFYINVFLKNILRIHYLQKYALQTLHVHISHTSTWKMIFCLWFVLGANDILIREYSGLCRHPNISISLSSLIPQWPKK